MAVLMPAAVMLPGFAGQTGWRADAEALRVLDARLATIAYRLTTANAAWCDRKAPAIGMVVHAIDQYPLTARADARAIFGFETPVAVAAVVSGSPAERAGIIANDSIETVDGKPVPGEVANAVTMETRTGTMARLLAAGAQGSSRLGILHDGARRAVSVQWTPACASDFELVVRPDVKASADGAIVQVSSGLLERFDDQTATVLVAHELAHNILRHRIRLQEAGVDRGLLAEFGRNGRLHRQTEDEADRLGAHLMRRAGYDPIAAAQFWRQHGGDLEQGIFRSRTHPSARRRAEAIESEIETMPPETAVSYNPAILTRRIMPLR